MVKIAVPTEGPWRERFRAIEMKFFEISESDWPTKFFESIKKITSDNYPAQKHELHIDILNQSFSLRPSLTTDDFSKAATLQEVQDDQVAPRLPFTGGETLIDVAASHDDLQALGLHHLIEE